MHYYKYIKPIIVLKLSILFLISCHAEELDEKSNFMQFNVDVKLLSTSIYLDSTNISLRPPIGWDLILHSEFKQLSESIHDGNNIFDINLNKAFKSMDGALLIISQVQSKAENFSYIPPNYIEILSQQFSIKDIPSLKFPINKIPILQYLINTDEYVIIRIFVGNNLNYQLDYIIPRHIYEKELKKIESSIGSINKQKEKT